MAGLPEVREQRPAAGVDLGARGVETLGPIVVCLGLGKIAGEAEQLAAPQVLGRACCACLDAPGERGDFIAERLMGQRGGTCGERQRRGGEEKATFHADDEDTMPATRLR